MFSTASIAAERVASLAWFMTILSSLIFVGVMVVMFLAIRRHRSRDAASVDMAYRGPSWIVWGGTVMPAVALLAVFVFSLGAMRREATGEPTITVRVTGHQWWWELSYEGAGSTRFAAANELHIPVGQPVRLLLTSTDVIHSFWVPQLQGKLDVIPGDTNELHIEARRVGTYGGACAEYCGAQHAHMRLIVVAEDAAAFQAWVAHQSADAEPPHDSVAMAGQRSFVNGVCAGCHTVRGTPARGTTGPDLTHVGSRQTLAAGTLPNSLGHLAGWIANPQALKPGALMPTLHDFTGPELRALAAYVSNLK